MKSRKYFMQLPVQQRYDLQFEEEIFALCPTCTVPFSDEVSYKEHKSMCSDIHTYRGPKPLEGIHTIEQLSFRVRKSNVNVKFFMKFPF